MRTRSPRSLRVWVRSAYGGRGGGGSSEAELLVSIPVVELPLYGVLSSSEEHAPRTMRSVASTGIMVGGRAKLPHAPGCESGLQGGRTR